MPRKPPKWNAEKINKVMVLLNIKRKDIAERLGESPQLISYYLKNPPSVYKAGRIAEALSTKDCRIDWRELIT